MKAIISKLSILILFVAAGAAVSCSMPMDGEYGTPYATYEIKGKVTDENGNPIKGIAVSCEDLDSDKIYTDEAGTFTLSAAGFPRAVINVSFRDVDEDENGGWYEDKSVKLETVHVKDGDGNWNFGAYEVQADVILFSFL
jgi:putative lipoprotein (rSAM/lipoprotein system)